METKSQLRAKLAAVEAENARLVARDAPAVREPCVAADLIRSVVHVEQEVFVVILLNARQKPIATRVVSMGSLAYVDVHPRDVFRDAIRMAAHSIIVGHNHPSGDPEPSQSDIELTERLCKVGKLMGIPVLDHIIVAGPRSVSMAEQGMLECER